ncbi:hypothetical protein [Neptuniibacter sp.]|jgi:hypothetical protein|uniref:hypothetical protein n=1 Tax=Neptuniibacter sp. TaxID=1962643 RepID=UPI003B5C30F3
MSSKLRLNDLSYDSDGIEDKLYMGGQEPRAKSKSSKPKRNKHDFEDYNAARSVKRQSPEHDRF